jgi:hypothetical protein
MEEKTIANLPNNNAEYEEIKSSMTPERARLITLLRESHNCTWRRVSEDYSYVFYGGRNDDQETGRILCAAAAEFLNEDWD